MSNQIEVVTNTITTTVTVEKLEIQDIGIDLVAQTINVTVRLIDVDLDNRIVGLEKVVLSGSNFSNVFDAAALNSLILSTLGYTVPT